ncbi:MAG: hypothetical protein WD801_00540 [Gemmatimonadaceae bacterium]
MRHARLAGLAVLALALSASTASAQRAGAAASGYWEFGTDAALTLGLDDPRFVSLTIPAFLVRAGYFTTPTVSIEPVFNWFSVGSEGATGFSAYTIGVGVLFHRSADRTMQQLFLRPFLQIADGSGGGDAALTVGAGVGVKRPILNGRAAGRAEANVSYNDASERLNLNALFGVSIYSR